MKLGIIGFLLFLAVIISLLAIAATDSSAKRLIQCFQLETFNLDLESLSNDEVAKLIGEKIALGTPMAEVESYLEVSSFKNNMGNRLVLNDKQVVCMFLGGNVFDFSFKEYMVTFDFDNRDNLRSITVAYGITGF